jgi:CheY-like chemotaxis protein
MQVAEDHVSEREPRPRPVVLLAEDHEDTRRVYGLILRHFGYEVEEASSGEEAIELAKSRRPSLVLMDIGLPGLDGWQTSRILKADPVTTAIPLIAFSARIESISDLLGRATFDGYIKKPVSPLELARRVGAYIDLLA